MEREQIIRDYHNFKANGINDKLSDAEKIEINDLNDTVTQLKSKLEDLENQKQNIEAPTKTFTTIKGDTLTRKLLAVDVDYSKETLQKIFSHGKSNYKIWFLNNANKLCVVDDCKLRNDSLYLMVTFDVKNHPVQSALSLDNFLYLIEKGDFKITNKKFIEYYLKPYSESNYVKSKIDNEISNIKDELNSIYNSDIYKKYNSMYNASKQDVTHEYQREIKGEVRNIAPTAVQQEKKKISLNKKLTDVKSIWNSTLTNSEKAYMIGWLCKHITTLWIKVVDQGVSDKVLSKAYPDNVYGTKYREKANSSGWDASSGIINVDTIENCPEEAIKKLSTAKHLQHTDNTDTIFNGKSIRNLDLVLFLLSEYNEYGFKTGVKDLCDKVDVDRLKYEKFKDNIEDFDAGYDA